MVLPDITGSVSVNEPVLFKLEGHERCPSSCHGDRMHTRTQGNGTIQGDGWLVGIVGGLLLLSLGFELLAHQVFGQTDVATLLWALYLGFWSYVLGVAGFLVLAIRWLVAWRRVRASRVAMNRLSSTESKGNRFEELELEAPPQTIQQGVAPVGPGRSSWDCHDRNEAKSQTKVA